ncbi:MAG: hypothetical protein JNM80_11475 [Phycisphaerae bacterium]|nr:hypothetical protein [Phycisphaerae bacterium]
MPRQTLLYNKPRSRESGVHAKGTSIGDSTHPDRGRSRSGPHASAVSVGAFGKHPGWDDHIDDPGIDTQRLIDLKQALYLQGIAGNIDSGAWDRLEPGKRLERFDHLLVVASSAGVAVARLWASRDGKGRAKYPLVACADWRGVSARHAIARSAPELDTLKARAESATTADELRAAIDATRQRLRAALESGSDTHNSSQSPLAAIVSRGVLGAEGLLRVMYHIRKEVDRSGSAGGTRLDARAPESFALRVPARDPDDLCLWIEALATLLPAGAAVTGVLALGQGWLDLIIGPISTATLFCLKATLQALPLTSDIPYTIDEAFAAEAKAAIAGTGPKVPVSTRPAAKASRSRLPIIAGAAGVALVAIVGGYFAISGGGSGTPQPAATPPVASRPPAPTPPAGERPTPKDSKPVESASKPPAEEPPRAIASTPPKPQPTPPEPATRAPEPTAKPHEPTTEPARVTTPVVPPATGSAEAPPRTEEPRQAAAEAATMAEARAQIEGITLASSSESVRQGWLALRRAAIADLKPATATEQVRQADRVARALGALGDRLPSAAADATEEWERALWARFGTSREAAITRAASEALAAGPASAADVIEKQGERVERALTQERDAIATAIAEVRTADRQLELGYAPDDAAATALSARSALERNARVLDGVTIPLAARVKSLDRIAAMDDPAALLAAAGTQLDTSLAAVRRLAELDAWPASARDLEAAFALRQRAIAAASTVDVEARRTAVEAMLAERGAEWWAGAFARAATGEEIDAIVSYAAGFGVDGSALRDPRLSLNWSIGQLRRASSDDEVRSRAATVIERSRSAGASALAMDLDAALNPGASGTDPAKLGPGALPGFTGVMGAGGGVRFSRADPPLTLEFRPVEVVGAGGARAIAYLSTTEASVGVFSAASVLADASGSAMRALLPPIPSEIGDPREGPRSWRWAATAGPALAPALSWLKPSRVVTRAQEYPAGLSPDAPTTEHPMQHVAPTAAALAARSLGCRLPTAAEWRAARAACGAVSASTCNLRDATWKRQQEHVESLRRVNPNLPTLESLSFADALGPKTAGTLPESDGVLWFAGVAVGPGPFHHIVGNVAEYVVDPGPSAWPEAASSPSALAAFLRSATIGIAGLSALSPCEPAMLADPPIVVYPARDISAQVGYADVGFRLAFSAEGAAPADSLAARLARVVTLERYVLPTR